MVLTASSTLSVISVSISWGDEPGLATVTVIVGKSIFGKRSTPRLKNENAPTTTSDITSIVAKTGRFTQISASHCISLSYSFQVQGSKLLEFTPAFRSPLKVLHKSRDRPRCFQQHLCDLIKGGLIDVFLIQRYAQLGTNFAARTLGHRQELHKLLIPVRSKPSAMLD